MDTNKKPNIIMLILDAARQDMFGCYGNDESLTPNIDSIASEGMVLRNHYAAGCGSSQAHVSIFTGQHSERHRMVHNFCDVNSDIKTIPFFLKQLGYKTFGHMKVSICPPAGYGELFGFDEMVYPGVKNNSQNGANGFSKKALSSVRRLAANTARRVLSEKALMRINANMYDGAASLQYLVKRLKEHGGSYPVFAYTTLLHPHMPYFPPKTFVDRTFNGKRIDNFALKLQYQHHAYANGDFGDAEEAIDSIRRLYKGEVLYADYLVGNFVETLKKENLFNNTILIVMSDHGEYLGEHRLLTHGNGVWEELFNIPCIIRYPEKIPDGSVINYLTSGMDILPTLFGLISAREFIEEQGIFDGRDIMEKRDDWNERFLVVDSPPAVLPERLKKYPNVLCQSTVISRALRTKEYKYIWQSNGREYLFRAGSAENDETSILDTNKEVASRLKEQLVDYYKGINTRFRIDEYPVNFGTRAAQLINNPVIRAELKKLGYLK